MIVIWKKDFFLKRKVTLTDKKIQNILFKFDVKQKYEVFDS